MVSSVSGPGAGAGAAVMGGASTWWDLDGAIACCVAAYQPKGAANIAASYINLANPGVNNAAPGVAPAHNPATGWTFDGATTWLTTSYDANVNTCSLIVRVANCSLVSAGRCAIGDARNSLSPGWFNARRYRNGNASILNVGVTNLAAGVMMVTPTEAFLNGASDGALATDGTNIAGALLIGADGLGGAPLGFYLLGDIIALGIYSCDVSAFALALATAMAAL